MYISADVADLKLHDSSEEIAAARELLTLGQRTEVKRASCFISKESTRKLVTKNLPGQRLVVSVPSLRLNKTRPSSGLNLDGNISASSEESEDEAHDDDDDDVNVVSKLFRSLIYP